MQRYNKAITAIVGAIVVILHNEGVEIAEDISEAVITIVTAALVYLVPNQP